VTTMTSAAAGPLVPGKVPAMIQWRAFAALLARDLTVLRTQPAEFIVRTLVQPLFFLLVLGYVSPRITAGASGGAGAAEVATTLLAGMLAMVILFQGIFVVAMPLVTELGFTGEIEDRVLSPLPTSLVALAKVVSGAAQGLFAALVVFPLAYFIPAAHPVLAFHPAVLLTLAPLAALMCASFGLFFGTVLNPQVVMALFAVLVTPLIWLGAVFFPWTALEVIPWVRDVSLAVPLTYVSEGFRAAVTPAPHLSLLVIYPVLAGFTAVLLWSGMRLLRRRVVG
jgi:ABC-2 type transport system permease protein